MGVGFTAQSDRVSEGVFVVDFHDHIDLLGRLAIGVLRLFLDEYIIQGLLCHIVFLEIVCLEDVFGVLFGVQKGVHFRVD